MGKTMISTPQYYLAFLPQNYNFVVYIDNPPHAEYVYQYELHMGAKQCLQ